MAKYQLSSEGRARFKRMRISIEAGEPQFTGYELLEYLYEHGAATAAELESHCGLDRSRLTELLLTFIHHGLVEGQH